MNNIEKNKLYRVHHNSPYLTEKYGKEFEYIVEGTDQEVMGQSWEDQLTPAAMLYAVRTGREGLDVLSEGITYYGHIKMGDAFLGEFLHESELGEPV